MHSQDTQAFIRSVPPRTLEGVSFTDGTLEELDAWLATLPEDPMDAARRLRNGIMELNRAKGFFTARFPELELLRPRVHELAARLSGAGDEAVSVAQGLQTELATGYRVVIAETLSERIRLEAGGTSESPTGIAVASIHRTLTELGHVLLRALAWGAPSPSALWEQVHQLWRMAEASGVVDERVRDATIDPLRETRVVDAWMRIVLLGTSDPHALRAGALTAFHRLLGDWTRFVAVTDAMPTRGAAAIVDVSGDDAPMRGRQADIDADAHLRFLDASDLIDRLARMLQGHEPGDDGPMRPRGDRDALLDHAVRAWGSAGGRGADRLPAQGRIDICVGIPDAHRLLRSDPKTPSAGVIRCELVDASPTGYGVRSPESGAIEVAAGSLLAVRRAGTGIWHVATARWVAPGAAMGARGTGRATRLGLELLGPRVSAGAARPLSAGAAAAAEGGTGKWQPVLIVPAIPALKQPATLFALRGRFSVADALELNAGGSVRRVTLRVQRSMGRGYQAFEIA